MDNILKFFVRTFAQEAIKNIEYNVKVEQERREKIEKEKKRRENSIDVEFRVIEP